MRLIDKHQRKPIYTDFEDEMGTATEFKLPGFAPADQWEKFRAKVRAFLLAHQELVAVHKLRTNQPLTADDLADHGMLDPANLYDSPFTDVTPLGPEGVFASDQGDRLIEILANLRSTAVVA